MNQRRLPPLPPAALAAGRSCDAGWCEQPSIGWRWYPEQREWLPTCLACFRAKGVPPEFKSPDSDRPNTYCDYCGEHIALSRFSETCPDSLGDPDGAEPHGHGAPLTAALSAEQPMACARAPRNAPRTNQGPS